MVTLAAGAAGGALFRLLHLPLPWTLGAMFGAALLTLAGPRWRLPPVFRDGARPVIGVVAGSAFTPEVVDLVADRWAVLPMLLATFVAFAALGQAYFRRVCGLDRDTAILCSTPGGLGEMAILGAEFDADIRKLVVIHSVRIVTVVSLVPFLVGLVSQADLVRVSGSVHQAAPAGLDWIVLSGCVVLGALLGRPLQRFAGAMIVPLALSAAAHGTGLTAAAPPAALVAAMQVVIGCITGARLGGIPFREARLAAAQGLAWTALLLCVSMLIAVPASRAFDLPVAAMFLSLSPGGFAEMTVMALAIGIEVAFVVACHVFRILYSIVATPFLMRLAVRWR
jgi:uncharacterized protein